MSFSIRLTQTPCCLCFMCLFAKVPFPWEANWRRRAQGHRFWSKTCFRFCILALQFIPHMTLKSELGCFLICTIVIKMVVLTHKLVELCLKDWKDIFNIVMHAYYVYAIIMVPYNYILYHTLWYFHNTKIKGFFIPRSSLTFTILSSNDGTGWPLIPKPQPSRANWVISRKATAKYCMKTE